MTVVYVYDFRKWMDIYFLWHNIVLDKYKSCTIEDTMYVLSIKEDLFEFWGGSSSSKINEYSE